MSEGQENIPPMSRLPRLTPSKPAATSLPIPTAAATTRLPSLNFTHSSIAVGAKRNAPSSPAVPPPAKRSVSGSGSSLPASTLKSSQRGAASFAPTIRKTSGSGPGGGAASTTTRAASAMSRPESRALGASTRASTLAASTRAASSGTTTATRSTRGVGATVAPRTGMPVSRRPTGAAGAAGPSSRPATALGRSVAGRKNLSNSVSVSASASAIGSGMASTAQFKSHDGRIENVEKMVGGFKELLEREQAKISSLQNSHTDLQQVLLSAQNTEREARRELSTASEEIALLRASHAREVDDLERQIQRKDREKRGLEDELKDSRDDLNRERETVRDLKQMVDQQSMQQMTLSAQLTASQTQLSLLQAEVERATLAVSAMKAELEVGKQKAREAEERAEEKIRDVESACADRIADIEEELRAAETTRRKLHNQVQELKGNIRVFARIRPALAHETSSPEGMAEIAYGDPRTAAETGQSQLTVTSRSESAMGREREQVLSFQFDKVFQPKDGQRAVFEEISMLAQSVLDGYNVCIFAYGQTGSGKSWTMEGGHTEEDAGMIPRAIEMIFAVSNQLKDRGWKYQMEGTFLEVYNEINDLLGSGQFDTKKHEIKIDKENRMTVTDIVSLPLSNPRQVSTLLDRARSRRAVAATLMNERSSRSHSVFSLKVRGFNPLTEEKSEGILNLVDLAGSERLASSGAGDNKDRMKETININKSLSALADVIGALGQGQQGGHVPYRNSMLTRLLQTSLSGSSKTLMLCNISPLAAHLGETVCSLRFATKVNSTPTGNAKRSLGKTG